MRGGGWGAIHHNVDPQDLDRREGRGPSEDTRPEHAQDRPHVGRELEAHELDDVVVDGAAFLYGSPLR